MNNTVLLGWEFGANLGHAAKLASLSQALLARGYRVVLVLKYPRRILPMLGAGSEHYELLQAPHCPRELVKSNSAKSVMEVLLNNGYDDAETLGAMVGEWRDILQAHRPAVVVADYAPTLLLAARASSGYKPSKTILVGSGFGEIPEGAALVDLTLSQERQARQLVDAEARFVAVANVVAQRFSLVPLHRFSDLYQVDHTFLCTVPELDFYTRPSAGNTYLGGLDVPPNLPEITWPDTAEPRVFAYIRAASEGFFRVLEALRRVRCESRVYAPGLSAKDAARYSSEHLKLLRAPVDMLAVVREVDMVIHHGGMGTFFPCLRYGVPCLVVPTQLEQQVLGWRAAELGVGLYVDPGEGIPAIQHKIEVLLSEPRFEEAAELFMGRYGEWLPHGALKRVCDYIDSACAVAESSG